jgi:acetylornithine deacetylase
MDPISVTQDLIRCPSETVASNHAVSELLFGLLKQLGFEVKSVEYQDLNNRPKTSLSARLAGTGNGRGGIAFFCHSDVVSSDGWQVPQGYTAHQAAISDGKIWGRGACDMKGPIAAVLSAIHGMIDQPRTSPVYVFITGDEECGMRGAELLVKQCPFYRQAVAGGAVGIISEPTSLQVVSTHKGGCRFRVSARGIAAHSSTAEGVNANWQLIPWLQFVHAVQEEIEHDPSLRNENFSPPTLCPNIILTNNPCEGNITVSLAQCDLFLRTMPDTQWRRLVDRLQDQARAMGLEVQETTNLPPMATAPDRPFVQQGLAICQQEKPLAASYATDGCCLSDFSDLIVLGPGNIQQAHRCDEWISVQQLTQAVELYRQFIAVYALNPQQEE